MKSYKVFVLLTDSTHENNTKILNIRANNLHEMNQKLSLQLQRNFGSIEYKVLDVYEM